MNEMPALDPIHEAPTNEETQAQTEAEADADIVLRAKEFYRMCLEATAQWREDALVDLRILSGDQWDPVHRGQRTSQGRPALTVNRLPQFVRQVTNEQRQSKPSVTVSPVDSGADVRTAEVLQGVIRNIEYTSNASEAYAAGGQSAAITGLGFWEVCCEFENERSFEQRISIKRIKNPMSVLLDPGAKEIAGDDARQAILSKDVSEGEWKSKFPDRDMPKGSAWKGQGDAAADWVAKSGVRIHEYRYVKDEPDTLIDVPPGLFEDMPEGGPALASELEPVVAQQLTQMGAQSRPTTRRKACWAKIAGDEVIEKGEFAGEYLQLVRVVGGELDIDGETIYEGVIRHARDPQKILNMMVSSEVEGIALMPKAPWLVPEGAIENYKEIWDTANTRTHSYLPYKPTSVNGQPVAPPQRIMAEANVSAITNSRQQAADDLKATTGIYDAALGARSNESSGRAILARESQAQTANFHFQDNLAAAIRYTGRILVDLIPKIYSGPRTLRILGEDGKHEMVPVNGMETQDGVKPVELGAGRYDVACTMGPSYQSRRQEASAQLLELVRVNPAVSQVAGDLVVASMDIPGGKEIAKRLQSLLPPEIRPPDEKKQPPPQILAQQLQQTMQMNEKLSQELTAAAEDIEKLSKGEESKERIEMTKLRVQLAMKLAEIESKESLALLKAEHDAISRRMGMTGFNEPIEGEQQGGING